MKKCPFCAEDVQDAAIVCKHCGRDCVSAQVTQASPQRGAEAQPRVSNAGYGILALGIFLLVIAAGASTLELRFAPLLFLMAFLVVWIGTARSIRGGAVARWGGGFIGACLILIVMGLMFPLGGAPAASGRAVMPQFPLQGAPIVTKAEFDRLREGISYEKAVQIIGAPGEVQSSSELAGTKTVMYGWMNANGSNMNAMFQDGKLITKAQFGLP